MFKEKKDCCGCSACASVCPKNCISMEEDVEGFYYPVLDEEACVQCGLCEKVCPIINVSKETAFPQEGYVVQNKNEKILRESTSGGAFTAIAEQVIAKGGVVFGVSLDENFMPYHTYVESSDDLKYFRNSKYVQSFIGGGYKQVESFLKQGRLVCFSGTPCQIEGLKTYLRKDYDNLISVDVVCRAVPSRLIYRKYMELQKNRLNGEIKSIRFRDKHYGYKYSTLNIVTDKNNGNYHKGVESDPWLRAFFSNICDRPSCYDCRFRKRYRESDITMWDCFAVNAYSERMDNDRGATKVLIHSEKGRNLFKEALQELNYLAVNADSLASSSVEMIASVQPPARRGEFFSDAQVLSGTDLFEKWFPETMKVKLEHSFRLACYQLGIYDLVKKSWYRIKHKK